MNENWTSCKNKSNFCVNLRKSKKKYFEGVNVNDLSNNRFWKRLSRTLVGKA